MSALFAKPFIRGVIAAAILAIILLGINLIGGPKSQQTSADSGNGFSGTGTGDASNLPIAEDSPGASPAPGSVEAQDPFPPDVALFSWRREDPLSLYPKGCPLVRGQECTVRFLGTYRLKTLERAVLRFGAYQNGSTEPVAHYDEPVVRGSEQMLYYLWFIVSESAQTIQFKVTLHYPDGYLLYEPNPAPPPLEVRQPD